MGIVGALLGGLGLFLLAVGMITDGLRMAAGDALRDLLARWTRTPLRGVAAGALITGIVQSSSAITVATIGFVNANLLTMHQALGVVYGANIGTTMTGWLVAAVGFKLKIELFALPMIGVGMILRLTRPNHRLGALGWALAGFGLFFIGIDVLRGSFEGLAEGFDLEAIETGSALGLLMFVGVGFFMTLVTQSSSAAIAITLTAATGGVVSLPAAAATVIGANVGTTSTAIFAAIGATPNARRVASAHVIFNLATGVVALFLLPIMLWVVDHTSRLLQMDTAPAVALALFHTLFNILGVFLLWPFTARLAAFLKLRFKTTAEDLGRPRYLDATTAQTPLLAQEAMRLELNHIVELARNMSLAALQRPLKHDFVKASSQAIHALVDRIDDTVAHIERSRLSPQETLALPQLLHQSRRLREAADEAMRIAAGNIDAPESRIFIAESRTLLEDWKLPYDDRLTARMRNLKTTYEQARENVLVATATGELRPAEANKLLDNLRAAYRMVDQLGKAARAVREIQPSLSPSAFETRPTPDHSEDIADA